MAESMKVNGSKANSMVWVSIEMPKVRSEEESGKTASASGGSTDSKKRLHQLYERMSISNL
jgi:hypothetical protein